MQCVALCVIISTWLTSHHYLPPQRDAILGSIYLESRFDPCVIRGRNGRGSAYLLQWLGPRRRSLMEYSNTTGCPSWQNQLEFMTLELNLPKYKRFWLSTTSSLAFYEFREHFGRGH